ncbi:MAG: YlxM family DNA-binding protein [Tyzzerella sp.]|uniref:UPF0122 protein IAC55_02190 n=1 Tax=Candidatus Fimicola merdigallinarum TaxID=2840819 RepID=A0A9D9H313_9FIRM|nr:YlxM family DNA-binding protein [Candidatus Fimicola merdigallinarum]
MDSLLQISLLFDFYGELLTEKQKNIYRMYYDDDLSLSEIALELDISRQAVRDQLKRTEKILKEYEEKLNLVEKFLIHKEAVSKIKKIAEDIENKFELPYNMLNCIEDIKRIADDILC